MNIYAIGTIFVQITLGMNTFITAQGKATTGMMTVLIGAVANIILWAIIMAFPQVFAKLFTTDAALVDFTAKALRIYCRVLFVFGIQIACQMTFVSIGNAPCSIIVAILRKFVLLIPLIYILPHFMENKTNAVYMAEPVADIIAVSCTLILFLIQFRKSLQRLTES